MSLINQMLKELEQRRSQKPEVSKEAFFRGLETASWLRVGTFYKHYAIGAGILCLVLLIIYFLLPSKHPAVKPPILIAEKKSVFFCSCSCACSCISNCCRVRNCWITDRS